MHDWTNILLGFIAVGCSSTNVVGGFLITDRMLAMFKSDRDAKSNRGLSEPRHAVHHGRHNSGWPGLHSSGGSGGPAVRFILQ